MGKFDQDMNGKHRYLATVSGQYGQSTFSLYADDDQIAREKAEEMMFANHEKLISVYHDAENCPARNTL